MVIRFLTQDHPSQSELANTLFSKLSDAEPGFISSVVLAEISWVLSRAYKVERGEIAEVIEGLLRAEELCVENAQAANRALGFCQDGNAIDFADALIAETAHLAGAAKIYTFDRAAHSETRMEPLVRVL